MRRKMNLLNIFILDYPNSRGFRLTVNSLLFKLLHCGNINMFNLNCQNSTCNGQRSPELSTATGSSGYALLAELSPTVEVVKSHARQWHRNLAPKAGNPSKADQREIDVPGGNGWLEKAEGKVRNKTQVVASSEAGEITVNRGGDSRDFRGFNRRLPGRFPAARMAWR